MLFPLCYAVLLPQVEFHGCFALAMSDSASPFGVAGRTSGANSAPKEPKDTHHWRVTQEVATDESEALVGSPLLRLDTDLPLFNSRHQGETLGLGFHTALDEALCPNPIILQTLRAVRGSDGYTSIAHLRQILKLDTAEQLLHGGEQRQGYKDASRKFLIRIAAPVQHMTKASRVTPYSLVSEQAQLDSAWQQHLEATMADMFSEDDEQFRQFCDNSLGQDICVNTVEAGGDNAASHVRTSALLAAKREVAGVVEEHGFRSMASMNAQKYMPQLSMATRGVYAKRTLHQGELLWPPIGGLMADMVQPDEAEAEDLFSGIPNIDETLCDVLIDSGAAALHALVWQDPEQHRRSHIGFGSRQLALNMIPVTNDASAVNQAKHFETLQSSNANVYPVRIVVGVTRRLRSRTARVQADDVIFQIPLLMWFVWNPIQPGEEVLGETLALLQETYGHDVETTISFADLRHRCNVYSSKLASAAARVLALLWARCELEHIRELQLYHEQEGLAVEEEEEQLVHGSDVASLQRKQELLEARKRLREQGTQLSKRRQQLESESRLLQQAAQRDLLVTEITLAERVVGSLLLIQAKDKVVGAAALHDSARRGIWHMRHNLGKQFMQDTKPNPLYLTDTQQRQLWRSIDVRLVHGEQVTVKNSAVAAAEASRGTTVAQAEAAADAERNDLLEQRLKQRQTKRYGLERVEMDKRLRQMREQLARLKSAVISAGLGPLLQVPMQTLPIKSPNPRHLLLWGPQPPDVHYNAFAARRLWTIFALTVLGLTPLDLLWLRRHLIFDDDPARRWYSDVYLPGKQLPGTDPPAGEPPGEPPQPGELLTRPTPEMHHQISRVQAAAPPTGAPGPPAYVHALAGTTPAWAAVSDNLAPQLQRRESVFGKATMSLPTCLGPRPRATASSVENAGSPSEPHWLLKCKPLGRLPSIQQQQREISASDKLMLSHDQEFHLPPLPGHVRMLTKGVLLRACQRSPTLHRTIALSSPACFEVLASAGPKVPPTEQNADDGDSDGSEDTILDGHVDDEDEEGAAENASESAEVAAEKVRAANSKLALRTARREVFVDGVQACNLLEHFHFANPPEAAEQSAAPCATSFQAARDEPMLSALCRLTVLRRDKQLKNAAQGELQWSEYPKSCVDAAGGRPAAALRTVRPLDSDELYLLTGNREAEAVRQTHSYHRFSSQSTGNLLSEAEKDEVVDSCRAVLTPTPIEAACAAAVAADEALLHELLATKPQLQASAGLHAHMEHLQDCLETDPASAASYLLPCLPPSLAVDEVYQLPCDDDDSDDCDDFEAEAEHVSTCDAASLQGVLPTIEHVLEGTITHKWEGGAVQDSHEPGSAAWRHWIALRDQRDFASAPLSVRLPALLASVQPTQLRDGAMSWCYRKQQLMPQDVKRTAELFDGGERHEGVHVPQSTIELSRAHGRSLTAFTNPDAPLFTSLRGLWSACHVLRPPPYAMEQDVVRRFTYSLSFLAGRPRPRHLLEPGKYQVDSTLTKRWAMATIQQLSAAVFHATDWLGRVFKPSHSKALAQAVARVELRSRLRSAKRRSAAAKAQAKAAAARHDAHEHELVLPLDRKRPAGDSTLGDVQQGSAEELEGSAAASSQPPRTAAEQNVQARHVFGARPDQHPQSHGDVLPSMPAATAAAASSAAPVSVFDTDDSEDDELSGQVHLQGRTVVRQQSSSSSAPGHWSPAASAVPPPAAPNTPGAAAQAPAPLPAYMVPTYEDDDEDAYLPPDHDM